MTIKRDMRSAFRFALRKRPLRTWLRPLCSRWSDELETFSGSEKEQKMIHTFKTRCFQRLFIFPSQNILANIIQVYIILETSSTCLPNANVSNKILANLT